VGEVPRLITAGEWGITKNHFFCHDQSVLCNPPNTSNPQYPNLRLFFSQKYRVFSLKIQG
jgi:hypothetical protein